MKKEKIELNLLLPTVNDADDSCIRRLAELLQNKTGIDAAHSLKPSDERPGQICVHYDPNVVSTGEVRELARRAGTELDKQYGHWLSKSPAIHARRASAIESRLNRIDGVLEAVVSPDGTVRVEYDRKLTSESAIADAFHQWQTSTTVDAHAGHDHDGQTHEDDDDHAGHDHAHGGIFGPKSELIFAILCGVFLLVGWLIETFAELNEWIPLGCYIAAYIFGGYYTVTEAIEKIRAGKFEIDFLMIVAAAGAASLGAWAEGALLLFLFSIGHALEGYAMGRAKRAIEALSELAPKTARVRRDGSESEIPVEELVVGDVVIIKPDERVPADGFVIAGESSINQAPITGESVPVDKRPVDDADAAASDPESLPPEHRAFAGTINQSGSLEIQVTKTRIRKHAGPRRHDGQRSGNAGFANAEVHQEVRAILCAVGHRRCRAVAVRTARHRRNLQRIVLPSDGGSGRGQPLCVWQSPHPVRYSAALPEPLAVASSSKVAGHWKVLAVSTRSRLTKRERSPKANPKSPTFAPPMVSMKRNLLRTAIAVEDLSKHPLAKAVVRDGKKRLGEGESGSGGEIPEATDLKSITGRGIQATVEGDVVHIGKDDLFAEVDGPPLPDSVREIVESLEQNGRTTMIVRRGDRYLGVIGLMDTPREASKRTIARLRELGIKRMIMISGDNQQVADAVAKEVGLDEARGDLMPDDKVNEIKKLQSEGGVAMVGDGVNDAPAMASASVGIAMGAAGSDVALETADVALMADNLDHLPLAIGLSRATRRIIRQNLWMSLGMVAFLVPATILGLNIGPAVALHEGSTLVVVFNALRLLAYKQ